MKKKTICSLVAAAMFCCSQEVFAQQDTLRYVVAPAQKLQINEGWGSSICWWGNKCGEWSEATVNKMIDWLVSPSGLNMNVFRYNIGGGDDPENAHCEPHHMGKGKGLRAEMEGFQDGPGMPYLWERDAAQRRIMLKIKEKRPDAIFEAFSNSAPWWMTYSGCCGGAVNANDNNLRPEYYEAFAHYLVDVCKHYKEEYGIEFRTLEPFNEPNTNYWPCSGSQEGCHFSPEAQADFLKVLAPILKESGLNTVISASDETNVMTAVSTFNTLEKRGVKDLVGQWNTHTYSFNNSARSQYGVLGRSTGCKVWMSETGSGGSGIDGNLKMAQRMFGDINYIMPSAWIDWQYHEEQGDQWCLVNCLYTQQQNLKRLKSYYVRQNVTRYFLQGYSFIPVSNENVLAAVNQTQDTLVISVINNTNEKVVHNISLPFCTAKGNGQTYITSSSYDCQRNVSVTKLLPDSTLQLTMPKQSIATVRVPVSVLPQKTEFLSGETYIIQPQSNINMALATKGTKLCIMPIDPSDESQHWTLLHSEKEPGRTMLRNGKGQYITYNYANKAYDLILNTRAYSTNSSYRQAFSITAVDDYVYKIHYDTKALDLNGKSLEAETKVGIYEYGTSPAADTRNWRFIKVGLSPEEADAVRATGGKRTSGQGIYSLSGKKLAAMQKGVNIVRDEEGTRKVMN